MKLGRSYPYLDKGWIFFLSRTNKEVRLHPDIIDRYIVESDKNGPNPLIKIETTEGITYTVQATFNQMDSLWKEAIEFWRQQ